MNILRRIAYRLPITSLAGTVGRKHQIRCLFSGEELGIIAFINARNDVQRIKKNSLIYKDNFSDRYLNTECSYKDFEDGLKDFIYIIDDTESDLNILREALTALVQKQKEYDGDKFRIGTIVMRALHFLNMPNEAIQLFEDKNIRPIFTQFTGHQVLFDLLYENKKYEDIIRIYENLNVDDQLYHYKYITVIILAALYRLNTPKSLEQAYFLWQQISDNRNKYQFRKSLTFIAGLAVKQNQPKIALEVLNHQGYRYHSYVTVRQIRILAWAQMEKFDEVFKMLRAILKIYTEKQEEQLTSISILDDIHNLLKRNGSKDIDEFCSLRNEIESLKLVTNKTLDNLVCAPFPPRPAGKKSQINTFNTRQYT